MSLETLVKEKGGTFLHQMLEEVDPKSAVILYFDEEGNANINQMWINVRKPSPCPPDFAQHHELQ